ncbi:hypothetical protein EQW76_00915 [Rhizobium sp. rho-13.1]|uniref:hypothetical protein n=1 Tax=Rhizobium sp. rho-13.1 TaxID=2506431 RepID=UPI00115EE1EA|nr:hypothetical protein [Rhizobium sp. rho-13.1]TQX91328.1 hypothetical protein EQW76_00915 [Rhizobium sp. rho-13.1]
MVQLAANIWADGPASAPYQPPKNDIRDWATWVEAFINAIASNGGLVYTSLTLLSADLAHGANSMAWVVGDITVGNNGVYQKVGASGSGSWVRVANLPYSFVVATDAGAGTANAILAKSSLPVSGSVLVWFTLFETNTATPVTISFNGGPSLTVKTNSGNNPIVGGLVGGMTVMGIVVGTTFRLVSDQSSEAILAGAEAAAIAASDYADFARNNWVVNGPFVGTGVADDLYPLTIDPGSANNMFPVVSGFTQMLTMPSYGLAYVSGSPKIQITVPLGVVFEVRMSNAVTIGTPSDGTVTTPKVADKNITYAKVQDISASSRLLGRKSTGSGSVEEISPTELRKLMPPGSIIQTVVGKNTSYLTASTIIPLDDTKPQISEGTLGVSVTITPTSATTKLRFRVSGFGATTGANAISWAIFANPTATPTANPDAIGAATSYTSAGGVVVPFSGEVLDFVPGTTASWTIDLRVAAQNGSPWWVNGQNANRLFGGAAALTLAIEEIQV